MTDGCAGRLCRLRPALCAVMPAKSGSGGYWQRVMRLPDDGDNLFITHDFPSAEQAGGFAHDPALRAGMEQSGVKGAPRIEIYTDV